MEHDSADTVRPEETPIRVSTAGGADTKPTITVVGKAMTSDLHVIHTIEAPDTPDSDAVTVSSDDLNSARPTPTPNESHTDDPAEALVDRHDTAATSADPVRIRMPAAPAPTVIHTDETVTQSPERTDPVIREVNDVQHNGNGSSTHLKPTDTTRATRSVPDAPMNTPTAPQRSSTRRRTGADAVLVPTEYHTAARASRLTESLDYQRVRVPPPDDVSDLPAAELPERYRYLSETHPLVSIKIVCLSSEKKELAKWPKDHMFAGSSPDGNHLIPAFVVSSKRRHSRYKKENESVRKDLQQRTATLVSHAATTLTKKRLHCNTFSELQIPIAPLPLFSVINPLDREGVTETTIQMSIFNARKSKNQDLIRKTFALSAVHGIDDVRAAVNNRKDEAVKKLMDATKLTTSLAARGASVSESTVDKSFGALEEVLGVATAALQLMEKEQAPRIMSPNNIKIKAITWWEPVVYHRADGTTDVRVQRRVQWYQDSELLAGETKPTLQRTFDFGPPNVSTSGGACKATVKFSLSGDFRDISE